MAALAVAIDALEAVLTEAVNNSKIMATLDREISKALGLLVDLILLPFLPLLVGGIIQLYMAILGFGNLWNKGVLDIDASIQAFILAIGLGPSKSKDPTKDLIVMALGILSVVVFVVATAILTGLAAAILAVPALAALGTAIAILIIGAVMAALLYYLIPAAYELGRKFGPIVADALDNIIRGFGIMWKLVTDGLQKNLIDPISKSIETIKNIILKISWSSIEKSFQDFLKSITFDNIKAGFKSFFNFVIDLINKSISGLTFGLGPKIPHLASGGKIEETGIAVVHKGETVVPAGQSGGITLNFYGYQDDVFIQKVRGVLRQDGSGYVL